LGRWVSRDPIEEEGGVNIFGMVRNSCVQYIDVAGMLAFDPTGGLDLSIPDFVPNSEFEWAGDPDKYPSGSYLPLNGPKASIVFSLTWNYTGWNCCLPPKTRQESYGPHYFYNGDSGNNYYPVWNAETINIGESVSGTGFGSSGSGIGPYGDDGGIMIIEMRWSRDTTKRPQSGMATTPLGWATHGATWNVHDHFPWTATGFQINEHGGGWVRITSKWNYCNGANEYKIKAEASDGTVESGLRRYPTQGAAENARY